MKAIKFLLGLGLMVASSSVFSQGLQGIVVEKYYQAQTADLASANANIEPGAPALTTNSVTYRVYADLATGYKVNAIYGDLAHPANFTTTTGFYNHNAGADVLSSPSTLSQILQNSRLLDSYLTIGAVCSGKVGVIEAEDNDGALTHTNGLLQNNPGGSCFGDPIFGTNAKDGMVASSGTTFATVSAVGLGGTILDALGANGGSVVSFNDGSYYTQNGIVGPASSTTNKVLIGQFTTDGIFTFAINIQVGLATGGGVQYYVSSSPTGTEQTLASLTLAPNAAPTVSVAGTYVPSGDVAGGNVINGSSMKFTATAADNVSVSKVEFFDGTTLLSTDTQSPYEHLYTAVQGSHSITAVATDDQCVATTSAAYAFVSAANQAPQIVLSTTSPTTTVVGNVASFTAAVTDPEGFPLSTGVQFYKNGVAVGAVDNTAPYTYNYTVALGAFTITAKVSDHLNLEGTSNGVVITGLANNPPTVSITSPTSAQSFTSYVSLAAAQAVTPTPAALTNITFDINAADDIYGNVTGVELFVDGVSVGSDNTASYSITWASTSGTKVITAVATDNNGATTTSAPLTLVINDALALPYEVVTQTQLCNLPTFCVPVKVSSTYTANDIKGYDVVMTYDATKVAPIANANGYNVTVNPLLLSGTGTASASWVDVSSAIQSPGVLNLSLSLTGAAPANAEWNGTNKDVFCVEFARIAPSTPTSAGFQPFEASTVAVSFLQESRITGVVEKPVTSGQMISTTQQNYVANLQYWNGNGAISYDIASPNTYLVSNIQGVFADGTTTAVAPVVPNVAGQFTHVLSTMVAGVRTAVPNISIQRDIVNNPLTSVLTVINSADAVIGKTILLNQPIGVAPAATTPSVYQIIALDVNRDGVLSAGDISQMQQRTVGILQEFMQAWNYNADGTPIVGAGPSKDFLFIDPASLTTNPAYSISTTYPLNNTIGYSKAKVPVVPFFLPVNVQNYSAADASCPTVGTANYQGIMLGDANGSYATFAANGTVKANEADYILVDLNNVIVEGTKVSVPVSIVSEETVNAFDLALGVNENTLTFVSMEDAQLGSSSASFYNVSDKTLRHTSYNTNNFTSNSRVAFFTFETVDGTISEKDFTSEFALLNDKEAEVRFTKSADLTNNSVDIYPNPSNGMFSVTSKVDGRVDIVDVTGKLVHPGVVVKANQMIEVNMPELSAGVYFVRVYSNNSMTTERIVISE